MRTSPVQRHDAPAPPADLSLAARTALAAAFKDQSTAQRRLDKLRADVAKGQEGVREVEASEAALRAHIFEATVAGRENPTERQRLAEAVRLARTKASSVDLAAAEAEIAAVNDGELKAISARITAARQDVLRVVGETLAEDARAAFLVAEGAMARVQGLVDTLLGPEETRALAVHIRRQAQILPDDPHSFDRAKASVEEHRKAVSAPYLTFAARLSADPFAKPEG